MKNLSDLCFTDISDLQWVLTDVDDTITTKGKLHPVALEALWAYHDAGLKVVCVTGGSAGWGDVYLRQWPVEAVVAESGTVFFEKDRTGNILRTPHPSIKEEGYRERARNLISAVLLEVPEARLSSDQFARIYDIAWETSGLSETEKNAIRQVALAQGACVATSSIHINCWFADTNKYEGARYFLDRRGVAETSLARSAMYCGDAPNDQVMFSRIPLSFGVGTVRENRERFDVLPAFCAEKSYGEGFHEICQRVLMVRKEGAER